MTVSVAALFAAVILIFFALVVLIVIKSNKSVARSNETVDILKETLNSYDMESAKFFKETEELNFLQKNTILNQKADIDNLNAVLVKERDKYSKIESLKKSSEVRLGLMAENFMPFIRDYPYDHKKFRFLANPVDGIQVTDDAIIFIEFKTGGARLSKSQKFIKELVSKGNVRFETFRINEDGASLKIESEMKSTVPTLAGWTAGEE